MTVTKCLCCVTQVSLRRAAQIQVILVDPYQPPRCQVSILQNRPHCTPRQTTHTSVVSWSKCVFLKGICDLGITDLPCHKDTVYLFESEKEVCFSVCPHTQLALEIFIAIQSEIFIVPASCRLARHAPGTQTSFSTVYTVCQVWGQSIN